ncbi:MAG: helix-turn-helix domain-containing protein [Candidatus Izemoplasmatales bacterium]
MNIAAIRSIMDPVRIKIIQELSIKKTATTKELSLACGDIPQATLYRHLKGLLNNDVIQVVSENKVRGILEKVYAMKENPSQTINNQINTITIDDLSTIFSQYILNILTDFHSCVTTPNVIDNIKKNIGFTSISLLLTDEELIEMMKEINQVFLKRVDKQSAPERKLRKISTILTTTQK